MSWMQRAMVIGVGLLLLGVGTGCSGLRRNPSDTRGAVSDPLEGRWVGKWVSAKRESHGGEMEMVVTRTGDQIYRATTRSRWWGVFQSSYNAKLVVTPVREGEFRVLSGKSLGLWGDYALDGRFVGDEFRGEFRAGSHTGKVEMRRAGL